MFMYVRDVVQQAAGRRTGAVGPRCSADRHWLDDPLARLVALVRLSTLAPLYVV